LENTSSQSLSPRAVLERGPWMFALVCLALFYAAWRWQGDATGFWLPGLGIGIALVSWYGARALVILTPLIFVARLVVAEPGAGILVIAADTALHIALIGASWWLYHTVGRGSRWLDDPRSATLFLLLVPGGLSALFAVVQASCRVLAAEFWLSRMVGILVVAPFLIVAMTPILVRFRLVSFELPPAFFGERDLSAARLGDRIELAGLTFATSVLGVLLLWTYAAGNVANWMLWACCLVLIVWTCIRQGLRGGCLCASVTSTVILAIAQMYTIAPDARVAFQSGIQGHLLAFCSSALLVGVSASWIRANEMRFRHVVSRIPFVVYSARLPYGIPTLANPKLDGAKRDAKGDLHVGPSISKLANVMLVSPAAKVVFGCTPEEMLGPFADWLERIEPADCELVIASLAQLCLQNQPVTCEYRLRASVKTPSNNAEYGPRAAQTIRYCWLRDTMTPHYSEEGLVDGWEGLVEDITDQRLLSHNLRKMTNMLQVLITNLPTGVYFVQAPQGNPILVNARARQLLGQREDLAAGLNHLSRIFRLHRPDGSEYPAEELPVCKALRLGVTCRANDIVVHRADGRKIPLITWAAPIDLNNTGTPEAAVWVLEDWGAMQQAEQALRDSELRLRAVIETMGEGLLVHDDAGVIVDCNPAASAILGIARDQLLQHAGIVPGTVCLKEDGTVFPRTEQPDQQALRTHRPARGVIVGMPLEEEGEIRWLLVNSLPLPVGPLAGLNPQKARVVTTFADVTQQIKVQDSLRFNKNKYQKLVETLPFMLVQRDKNFNITYLNPAAVDLTGYTFEEMTQPEFCTTIVHPDDLPAYQAAGQAVAQGQSARIESRLLAKDGSTKIVLGFFHPNFHHGEVVGSTSLAIDITMQRRLEEELHRAKHLELVGRLASGTVHDFNNLLTVLMGIAGLAKTELAHEHPAWQHLTRIEEIGEQAAHLAGQLLTFSKQRPRESRAVDLNAVVAQTVKMVKGVLPPTIRVEALLDPSMPLVLGDETAFKQIVMNLFLNARDAMPEGGVLTIRTDLAAPADDRNGQAWVHLAIQDAGIGMSADVRERIFEPFFSTKERGTGLGLAVVQQIIKEFGGRIDVWSEPGQGTRFDIWLVRPPQPV
jgi:PAS domain S-box-containing protein